MSEPITSWKALLDQAADFVGGEVQFWDGRLTIRGPIDAIEMDGEFLKVRSPWKALKSYTVQSEDQVEEHWVELHPTVAPTVTPFNIVVPGTSPYQLPDGSVKYCSGRLEIIFRRRGSDVLHEDQVEWISR